MGTTNLGCCVIAGAGCGHAPPFQPQRDTAGHQMPRILAHAKSPDSCAPLPAHCVSLTYGGAHFMDVSGPYNAAVRHH